jgi:hypothetical protein
MLRALPPSLSSVAIVVLVGVYGMMIRDGTMVSHAFVSPVVHSHNIRTTTTTAPPPPRRTTTIPLGMISGWGVKGNPAFRTKDKLDPERQIQDYLPEPGPVEARTNIDGTILVSGLVNDRDRTDQFLFDLLNHEDSAFEFKNITAVCDDAVFSKKRLLSRSARYTGLLDKLHIIQATTPGALPTTEQLVGVQSWLAVLENTDGNNNQVLQQCEEIGRIAAQTPGDHLKNVAILLAGVNELSASACQAAVDAIRKNENIQYTIVAVGNLDDTRVEGSAAYQYESFGVPEQQVLPAKATFSREEAYRFITELLQLECGINQAFVFAEVYNPNITEAKLIKGLREAGYARPQEIDHMIRSGPKVCSILFSLSLSVQYPLSIETVGVIVLCCLPCCGILLLLSFFPPGSHRTVANPADSLIYMHVITITNRPTRRPLKNSVRKIQMRR